MAEPTLQDLQTQINNLTKQYNALQKTMMLRVTGTDPSNVFNPAGASAQVVTGTIALGYGANLVGLGPVGTIISWIGSFVVGVVQFFGAWFKTLYVGGTDASNAPFVADASGNVTAAGITVNNATINNAVINNSTENTATINNATINTATIHNMTADGTIARDDGTATAIIDSNRPIGGATSAGVGVFNDAHPNRTATLASGFMVGFNDNALRMWNVGFSGASPGQHGLVGVHDGTGSGGISGSGDRVQIDGGQGHLRLLGPGSGNPGLVEIAETGGVWTLQILSSASAGAVAGGATLPINPAGFLEWNLNGTTIHIPYYN